MKSVARFALLLIGLLTPMVALAAPTLRVDINGILTGADNVQVGGNVYNVVFVDGTCAGLFSGCDELADFTFQNVTGAAAAAKALLDQVLLDGPAGNFDTDPLLTLGCPGVVVFCDILTPYDLALSMVGADNAILETGPNGDQLRFVTGLNPTQDTSDFSGSVFAVWHLTSTAVPLPGTVVLLGLGVAALGLVRRKRA